MKLKSLLLGAMLCSSLAASAQEAAATVGQKEGSDRAEMLSVAGKLVKYGYQTKTALPLIQALQIYQNFNFTPGTETPASTTDAMAPAAETQKADVVSYDAAKLTADATTFADGNKNLLALIKSAPATRGAVGGAITRVSSVKAGYTDTWTFNFRGGESAYVVVSGDGDTDLDLYIYDGNGNFITSDTDRSDDCVCTFTPKWTGKFYIKIKNLGAVYNRYVLVTN